MHKRQWLVAVILSSMVGACSSLSMATSEGNQQGLVELAPKEAAHHQVQLDNTKPHTSDTSHKSMDTTSSLQEDHKHGVMHDDFDLAKVGTDITANNLFPIEGSDFSMNGYSLGDVYRGAKIVNQHAAFLLSEKERKDEETKKKDTMNTNQSLAERLAAKRDKHEDRKDGHDKVTSDTNEHTDSVTSTQKELKNSQEDKDGHATEASRVNQDEKSCNKDKKQSLAKTAPTKIKSTTEEKTVDRNDSSEGQDIGSCEKELDHDRMQPKGKVEPSVDDNKTAKKKETSLSGHLVRAVPAMEMMEGSSSTMHSEMKKGVKNISSDEDEHVQHTTVKDKKVADLKTDSSKKHTQSTNAKQAIKHSHSEKQQPTAKDEEKVKDSFTLPEGIGWHDVLQVKSNDNFTTYTMIGSTITTYTGIESKRFAHQRLRGQGAHYFYSKDGTITNIHVEHGEGTTVRDIGIGNTRGETLFAYGAPNVIWRDANTSDLLFLYEGHSQFYDIRNDRVTRALRMTQDAASQMKNKRYLLFTFHDDKIKAIDMIDGQVWPRLGAPNLRMNHFQAGQLTSEDFVLRGLQLNDTFHGSVDGEWKTRGTVFNSDFISYRDYAVGLDKKQCINRIFLNGNSSTTRRGVTIGDTKYLLLYMYGEPTHIETVDGEHIYEYKNPFANNSYLLFTIDKKDKFINMVMVSDRPASRLR